MTSLASNKIYNPPKVTLKQKKLWFAEQKEKSFASLEKFITSKKRNYLKLTRRDKEQIEFEFRGFKFRMETNYSILNGQIYFYTFEKVLNKWKCIDYLEMWGNTVDVHFTNGIRDSVALRINTTLPYLPFGFHQDFGADYMKQLDIWLKQEIAKLQAGKTIVSAQYVDGYKIEITFSDGKVNIFDYKKTVMCDHEEFIPYRDIKNFKKFKIVRGNTEIAWGKDWDMMIPLTTLYCRKKTRFSRFA